jgi:hypothetical protein
MLQPRGYSATPQNHRANQSVLVAFPREFLMGKMNDALLDHDRDLVVLCNAASDLRALQSDVPARISDAECLPTRILRG